MKYFLLETDRGNKIPFSINNCLGKRKEKLGKVLLYDILKELNIGFSIKDVKCLEKKIIKKILQDYDSLGNC